MSKAMFLLFDSSSEARMMKGSVKDGLATIDKKTFYVDESTPIFLKKGIRGFTPLYIVKWSEIQPSMNLNPTFKPNGTEANNPIKPINPKFKGSKNPEKELTPELLRKLIGIKILGNMIKAKRNIEMGGMTMLALGAGIAIIIMYALIYMGII